jgi:PadR family transcriptional regulator, regulatory protein AphA
MTTSYSSALSPEYALLGFLAQQPAHGYQLYQRLASELGQVWHISLSQTYNILKRLEAQGLITGELQTQVKLPPRQQFHLTSAGRERLEKWLYTPTGSSVRGIRVEFITRLYFASLLSPEFPDQIIKIQIQEAQSGLARLERLLLSIPMEQTFNRLSLDLRVRQLRAVLEWLAEVQLKINRGQA